MEILNNVDLTYAENAKDNVGISFSNDRVELVVPKFFRIEKDEHVLKTDILLFLESISIAKKINYKSSSNTKENDNGWPIESYVWLIHDYLENGFYYKRETVYSKDLNGKINWKRTLKNTPIISDGNIIYDKLITSKTSPSNDVITHIYKICLRESLEKVGWLFNYGFKILEFPLISSEEMVYRVKSEMASTFDDIKRIRFKHMLNILEKVDDKAIKKDKFQYQINNYYYVFEQMIDSIFNGLSGKEKKRYNPTGHWMLLGEEDPKKASDLRPDTICKVDDETFIIDAKMYQYGCTHNIDDLPDTQSLQKQITYGEYVFNKIDRNGKVRNAFILPYDKELESFKNDENIYRYDDSNLVYIGEGYVDWTDVANKKDHERIFAFLIDFNYLLNHYTAKNKMLGNLATKIDSLLEKDINNRKEDNIED